MKKKQFFKGLLAVVTILIEIVSLCLLGYGLYLYNGIETFYRIYAVIILIYIVIVLSYFILRQCTKRKSKSFIIVIIISILFTLIQSSGYYYLTKVYKAIDSYSNTENNYSSSLISYNKEFKSYKDLKDNTIGIVNDTNDIEGNVLPKEIIEDLKLEDNNTIKEYNSSIELLVDLKDKKIDAAFFTSNYIDMFYTLEGYEEIENDTVLLYEKTKEYNIVEDTHDTTNSTFTKPFTILFIGLDASKDGAISGQNADVLILVTFNPKTLQATMTSVPRDTYLKTACSGNSYRRINTTTWGSSSSCAVKTIENLFDVKVDYYAKINFKGVVQLVDSVGGIDVEVDYAFCEQNSSRNWGKNTVYVDKGNQHLNGEQALALARNRHKPNDGSSIGKTMGAYCADRTSGDRSDYTRGKNQLKVIMGVVKAATKLRDVNVAVKILEDISKNFQTNIKSKDVMELYGLAKTLLFSDDPSHLINVQRMQLKNQSVYKKVYDINSKSYPWVAVPYSGSIKDIKKEIKLNLGKTSSSMIKKTSFDINEPYKDQLLGQGSYSQSYPKVLADVSSYSVDKIKSYANSNNLTLKFINIDTKETVNISSWDNYKFYSQAEHKDIIIELVKTLTIYVKKKEEVHAPSTPEISTTNNNEISSTDNSEETD